MPENSHHYNVCTLFLKFLKLHIVLCIVPKPNPDPDPGPEKTRTPWKNRTSRTKTYHIKSRDVQDLVFMQITFENCTLNFYFENSEIGIKKTIANLQPFLAWNVSTCLRIFMQPLFK